MARVLDRFALSRGLLRIIRRDQRINEHWFSNLLKARAVMETRRREYNEEGPKKALGGMTSEAYAKHLAEVRLQ